MPLAAPKQPPAIPAELVVSPPTTGLAISAMASTTATTSRTATAATLSALRPRKAAQLRSSQGGTGML
ncbi:hypothetical protein BM1_06138 [Bipolaris maydis]|nr:hypothetical protein BM1_06138 [Bipolaris maydis]